VFWKRISLITLISGVPLIITNILSDNSLQRDLLHQYSLPIALVMVIAVVNGISKNKGNLGFEKKRFLWILLCWFALAKPLLFFGPYLDRLNSIKPANAAFEEISIDSNVITTSYLVPHLSQRQFIKLPTSNDDIKSDLEVYNVLLLNPLDPGVMSNSYLQNEYLKIAKANNWKCKKWENNLELCKK
jgi:hypothetical protein